MGFLSDFLDAHTDPWGGDPNDRPAEFTELPRDPLGKYAPHNLIANALKPKRPPRPGYEAELYESARAMRQDSNLLRPVVRSRLADIVDTRPEVARARGRAGADTAQAAAGATPFERAMSRGRALSRVALQGQNQVESQALRERVGMHRFGQAQRAGVNRELSAMSGMQANATAVDMMNSQLRTAQAANTLGTIAGAWMRYGQQNGRTPRYGDGVRQYPSVPMVGGVVA